MTKRHQIVEGEWTWITKRGHSDQCCHCGLTHIVDYREHDGKFQVRKRIDRRATAAARRAFQFNKDED